MVPPSASSSSSNTSTPYKLPAAPLIARNLSTLLNGSPLAASSSSTLPIEALRDLLTKSRPPLVGDASNQVQVQEAEEDGLPITDPLEFLSSNRSLEEHLQSSKARADLLDLAQGLALALAKPQDGDSVAAAGATPTPGSGASASAVLSLVESRLLLAACYVVLALLPPAAAAAASPQEASSSNSKSNPASRLAQASTQLDVARDELREAQRSHLSQVKRRRNAATSSSLAANQAAAIPPDEENVLLTQQLAQHQARLLLASANVAHLSGRPDMEVKRLVGWWVKAVGQAGMGRGKGSGSGGGAEGVRGVAR